MIELLLETGIRRGELLKLYTTDINKGSQHAYVSINDRENDPGDLRAEEPALKTHGRTVGITTQLYEVYEHYIQSERRPWRDGKPINRRCHAVMRVVTSLSRPTDTTPSAPRQPGADLTLKEIRREQISRSRIRVTTLLFASLRVQGPRLRCDSNSY